MKRMLFVLFALTLVVGSVWAYPGPNSIGIYAVTDATGPVETCITVAPFTQVDLYLCLTNPEVPAGVTTQVSAWELELHQDSTDLAGGWDLFGGVDVGYDIADGHYFTVGNGGAPLMPNDQNVIVLAHLEAFYVNADGDPIHFVLSGHPGSTSFPDGDFGYAPIAGTLVPCVPSTGVSGQMDGVWYSNTVFAINDVCTVANEDRTWSGVKQLYR